MFGDSDTAVEFDGSTCKVELGDRFAFAGRDPFSIEAWVITVAASDLSGSTFQHVFTRERRMGGPVNGYALAFCEGAACLRGLFVERVVETNQMSAGRVAPASGFTHVVGTFDGDRLALYVDGVELLGATGAGAAPSFASNAYIGAGPDPNDLTINFFKGTIDEVAIYRRALTHAEVVHHHDVGIRGP